MLNKGRNHRLRHLGQSAEAQRRAFPECRAAQHRNQAVNQRKGSLGKRHKGAFDRVLVDAPCSGTGTWRRNPDARWRALGAGLDNLLPLQAGILASAARLVKPGGRLAYATCSMLPEENEKQVATFLAAHPAFRVVTLREAAPRLTDWLIRIICR